MPKHPFVYRIDKSEIDREVRLNRLAGFFIGIPCGALVTALLILVTF